MRAWVSAADVEGVGEASLMRRKPWTLTSAALICLLSLTHTPPVGPVNLLSMT